MKEVTIKLVTPMEDQQIVIDSTSKRKIVYGDRCAGKTTCAEHLAIEAFLGAKRVLYVNPYIERVERFWENINYRIGPLINKGIVKANKSNRTIEWVNPQHEDSFSRIKVLLVRNVDSLKGRYADLLMLDDRGGMAEDIWEACGPILLDRDGDAVIFTDEQITDDGDWEVFHFIPDNPYLIHK